MTVAKAAALKGIHNPYQLHKKTGISIPRVNKIWDGIGKFDLRDIDRLCNGLKCSIKDIFKRVPISEEEFLSIEGNLATDGVAEIDTEAENDAEADIK